MKIQVLNQPNLKLPQRATPNASAFDVFASEEPKIVGEPYTNQESPSINSKVCFWKGIDYIEYKIGLRIAPEDRNIDALCFPRSSISDYNLILKNSIGLLDNDYRGEILVRFAYMWQPIDALFLDQDSHPFFIISVDSEKIYHKGDKIGQLRFDKNVLKDEIEFVVVDNLNKTVRGKGGFGHTGKK